MQSYRHSRNKVFLIRYHLVWCPKRRKPVLVGEVKQRLEQIVHQVADELRIKVLELAINPDHIHLFISAYPTIPVHKIVRRIKGRSSNTLRREFPELLKLPSLWTHSYYASTKGQLLRKLLKSILKLRRVFRWKELTRS